MAQECLAVIGAIQLLKGGHLDSSIIDELEYARYRLKCVSRFLVKLEEVHPENTISTQLGTLFQQAHDGFSEICTHMDQHYTIKMTKALKKIKLENIAERLKAASKPSTSTRGMISEVLKILKPENIAERIKASKPSASSSRITTMEMVRFVNFLLDYVKNLAPMKLRYLQAFFILTSSRCIEHETSKSSRSETTMKSGCMLDFVNGLREDLRETPLSRDEVRCLRRGLYSLSIFLKDLEYAGTPLKEFSSLQSLIEALAFEAAFVIY
ncbi:hypothetical protein H5410_026142 [Solanum commersonii]|uniref:Uncharacterized protein n=1 Tax=Solanum commersonii TaxID=4109 RepID=A0A9J5YW72_SOLCO|nr:hypothetical protein H5410_026142 [Solanum commersonii]